MNSLNLPPYAIKIAEQDGRRMIFDFLRRKFVALTPEEWVRQHFVHFLTDHKDYPAGLMANEVELKIGDKRLRCDSILYNKEMKPQMIIEYKALHITLTQKVFQSDHGLQPATPRGLSHRFQRSATHLLPHGLCSQHLSFPTGNS